MFIVMPTAANRTVDHIFGCPVSAKVLSTYMVPRYRTALDQPMKYLEAFRCKVELGNGGREIEVECTYVGRG